MISKEKNAFGVYLELRRHLRAFLRALLLINYPIEEVLDGSGYDPDYILVDLHIETGAHGVSFARTGLSVGEDSRVVSVQRALHETIHARFVNRPLIRLSIKNVIVSKGLVGAEENLRLPLRYLGTNPAHINYFASYLRPYSATSNQSSSWWSPCQVVEPISIISNMMYLA